MRGFLQISQNKLPKRAFRAMLPTIFTEKAPKTIVSCEASSKFHSTSSQNERFARCFRQFSQKQASKTSVSRDASSTISTEQASKKIVSCEASSKFHRTSSQNDRFVRGFLEISQNKLPKRAFRARLPQNFTEQASKTNVLCEASSKFPRTSFQNKGFVRGFLEISQNNLPKRSFRARLPPNFIEQSFQNERFVRGFLEISQNKLPKRTFRARLLPNFIEQSFQNERFARCFR